MRQGRGGRGRTGAILNAVRACRHPSPASPPTGCWSPTRPGVFYTARQDGVLDVWDFYYRQVRVAWDGRWGGRRELPITLTADTVRLLPPHRRTPWPTRTRSRTTRSRPSPCRCGDGREGDGRGGGEGRSLLHAADLPGPPPPSRCRARHRAAAGASSRSATQTALSHCSRFRRTSPCRR